MLSSVFTGALVGLISGGAAELFARMLGRRRLEDR